jgi:hypothetical protein
MTQPRCSATTKDGTPCQRLAVVGEVECASHLGLARRPSLLTEDLQAKVVALLRNGNFVEPVCMFVGIHPSTYYHWRERGEADECAGEASDYREFYEATTRAIGEGELIATSQLMTNVRSGDQRAIEYYLERRHRERWTRATEVKHSGGIAARTAAPAVPEDVDRLLTVAQLVEDIGALPATGGGLGGNGHSNGGVGGNGHGAA